MSKWKRRSSSGKQLFSDSGSAKIVALSVTKSCAVASAANLCPDSVTVCSEFVGFESSADRMMDQEAVALRMEADNAGVGSNRARCVLCGATRRHRMRPRK